MLDSDLIAHVKAQYPLEAVGYTKDGKFYPLVNSHPDPANHFRISISDLYNANPDIIWHSHPSNGQANPHWPSKKDLETFYSNSNYKWGIVATDGEEVGPFIIYDDNNPLPLLGRTYTWGIHDCYSIMRDWYKLQGVKLKDIPRDYQSFVSGMDLYNLHFKEVGFVEVGTNDIQIGDVLLLSIMSSTVNHAAIVVGENEIYHHQIGRLSCSDRLDRWSKVITKVIRYAPNTQS